jgi:IS4 transposase
LDFRRLYEIHIADAFFVTRAKDNLRFSVHKSRKVDKESGLRCDQSIRLLIKKSKSLYPNDLRRIKYYDNENKITLVFITNNFELSALEIAAIYKNRWQIEVFFRWIKQNLQIKSLWGHSENAVKTHLWVAICTYLIVAKIKIQLRSKYSVYEMMQIIGISTFSKTPINELFTDNQKNQKTHKQLNLFNHNDL